MKKIILVFVCCGLIIFLSGCGSNGKQLKCSYSVSEDEGTVAYDLTVKYNKKGTEIKSMSTSMSLKVNDDYASYLKYYENSAKEELEELNKLEGVKGSVKTSNNKVTFDIKVTNSEYFSNLFDELDVDFDEDEAEYKNLKEYLTEEGLTCK